MKTIAVLTPTYNRKKQLYQLYISLCAQNKKDFVWYIIDDGSSDDTESLIKDLNSENKIEIQYLKKNNGGKHTAINYGMKHVKEALTFIVDSDDSLLSDAISTICEDYRTIKDNDSIAGLSYLRMNNNGKVLGKLYSKNELIDTYINERVNRNIYGDKCEIYKTNILKKFPFPVYAGEKFISEAIVWCRISRKYMLKFYNKCFYICEYLEDGYTLNIKRFIEKNPIGALTFYNEMTQKPIKFFKRLKYGIAYVAFSFFAKRNVKEIFGNAFAKTIIFVVFIPGLIYYLKRKWKRR